MADDDRRKIFDRANRMLRQSKTLRQVSEELLQESNDLRKAARGLTAKRKPPRKKSSR
jgi:hypothetical protein